MTRSEVRFAERSAEADRGCHPGFARHEFIAGGPGSLSVTVGGLGRGISRWSEAHVVWVDGVLRLNPEPNTQSNTFFRWIHPEFSELSSNAELREFLTDLEFIDMGEVVPDVDWTPDLPTIDDEPVRLDVLVIYARDPQVIS